MAALFVPVLALAQQGAQIHVTVSPEGSSVRCDGQLRGVAPATIPGMAPGKHLFEISKKGYRDLRRTVTVKEGQKLALEFQLEPLHGLLLVHSTPQGADVTIDGASKGNTPVLITDIPLGTYRMHVAKPGYLAKELELRVARRRPEKIDVVLTSNSATLVLDSKPRGATVTVNGIAQGTTPCSVDRIVGDARIEIQLEGYEAFRQTVTVAAGQREELVAVLKSIPAKLKIVSRPEGARIYVDNQFRGAAPVTLDPIDPGNYRIRAEMTGFEILARTVALQAAEDRVEEFRMQSDVGSLEITTEPAGVSVFIDGQEKGTTTSRPGQTDRVSDPLRLRMIASGKRTLLLTKKGYQDVEGPITVERENVTVVHRKLERRFIRNYEVRTRTRTVRGVLVEIQEDGAIKLETDPGVFQTIKPGDIRAHMPLRTGE